MIRVFIFLALVLAAALGFAWLADRPGSVAVTWQNHVHEIDIITAVIAVAGASLLLSIGWTLLRTVFRIPGILGHANRNRRQARGFDAVSRGLVAVSAGDGRTAQRQAAEAERLLGAQPLTLLLAAQSAQLAGDAGKAEKAFGGMLEDSQTRIVGLRGLHIEAQRRGDSEASRFYAEEAYKLAPGSDWASQASLAYRCAARDWLGAMALVEQAASRRLIDKETARKQRAVLLTADAMDKAGIDPDASLRAVQEAVRLDASLPPAAALLGRRLSEKGDYNRASKVLEACWTAGPHPDVADAYLDVRLGDSAQDRLKRGRHLLKLQPTHPESRLTLARAAIDAREFRTARENLETLVLEAPTVRACVLMADLEEEDGGNLGFVREWLARASRAERDKAWVADGKVSETWAAVSPSGKVGGFVWMTPPQAPGSQLIEEMARKSVAMPPPTPMAEVIEIAPEAPAAAVAPKTQEPKAPEPMTPEPMTPIPDDPGAEPAPKKTGWKLFQRHNAGA